MKQQRSAGGEKKPEKRPKVISYSGYSACSATMSTNNMVI